MRAGLPELPAARKERLMRASTAWRPQDAGMLAANRPLGDYFESWWPPSPATRKSANWVLGDFSAYLNASGLDVDACPVGASALGGTARH